MFVVRGDVYEFVLIFMMLLIVIFSCWCIVEFVEFSGSYMMWLGMLVILYGKVIELCDVLIVIVLLLVVLILVVVFGDSCIMGVCVVLVRYGLLFCRWFLLRSICYLVKIVLLVLGWVGLVVVMWGLVVCLLF